MFPDRLATARLLLRPIEPGDAPAIFQHYAQDPEVTRFLTWRPHATLADTDAFVAAALAATAYRVYVLIRRNDGRLLGALDLRNEAPHGVGFGYVLARAHWGQGLMTEALTACADWALAQDGIWRFASACDAANPASGRVMEKAGLTYEGTLRRWLAAPNLGPEPRDCRVYARVR